MIAMDPQPIINGGNPPVAPAPPDQPGAPQGGQEIGEHGPYYIYGTEGLLKVPPLNIVRDYDYAYKVSEHTFKELVDQSWCNAFEASAILSTRALKSRSVVVVSNNGWMEDKPTVYTWFIRIQHHIDAIDGVNMGEIAEGTESGEDVLNIGRSILWPICPERATNAREHWQLNEELRQSRLVLDFIPSEKPFDFRSIPNAEIVTKVPHVSTMRFIQSILPVENPGVDHNQDSTKPLTRFVAAKDGLSFYPSAGPRFVREGGDGYRTTSITASTTEASGRGRKYCKLVQHAPPRNGALLPGEFGTDFTSLCPDLQNHIWGILATEATSTPGSFFLGNDGNEQTDPSLEMWLCLRAVCRQSRKVVEDCTVHLMKAAQLALSNARSSMVADCLVVSSTFVPRGIQPHKMQLELDHNCPEQIGDQVLSYIRVRSGKAPTDKVPRPPERATVAAAPAAAKAKMSVPSQQAKRCSLRKAIKASLQTGTLETAIAASTSKPDPSGTNFCDVSINFLMDGTESEIVPSAPPSESGHLTNRCVRIKLFHPAAEPLPLAPKRAKGFPKLYDTTTTTTTTTLSSKALGKRAVQKVDDIEHIEWVCCDDCEKWRTIPAIFKSAAAGKKKWVCKMHPNGFLSCDHEEERVAVDEVTIAEDDVLEDDPEYLGIVKRDDVLRVSTRSGAGPSGGSL